MNALDRHPHRPPHPARGLPPAARARAGGVPARVRRARPARAPLVRRLRLAAGRLRRGGGSRDCPSSATSATTTRRRSSRRSRSPTHGPRPPGEPLRRRRDARPLRPRPRDGRGAGRRPRRGRRRCSDGPQPSDRGAATGRRGSTRRLPGRHDYERAVVAAQGAHPRGRRLPDRALAARRAADLGERDRALPLAAARQPLAVPVPARARRARAGRLLARDAGQGRGPCAPR